MAASFLVGQIFSFFLGRPLGTPFSLESEESLTALRLSRLACQPNYVCSAQNSKPDPGPTLCFLKWREGVEAPILNRGARLTPLCVDEGAS